MRTVVPRALANCCNVLEALWRTATLQVYFELRPE